MHSVIYITCYFCYTQTKKKAMKELWIMYKLIELVLILVMLIQINSSVRKHLKRDFTLKMTFAKVHLFNNALEKDDRKSGVHT